MFNKIIDIPYQERRIMFMELEQSLKILFVPSNEVSELEIQSRFQDLLDTEGEVVQSIIDQWLKRNTIIKERLALRREKKLPLHKKRWKKCEQCSHVFMDWSLYGNQSTCSTELYVKFSDRSKTFSKSSSNRSKCDMNMYARRKRDLRKDAG